MAKRIRFQLMVRFLMRANAIAAEQGMAEEVTQVHSDVLASPAAVFLASHEKVAAAQTHVAKTRRVANHVLVGFDPVYCATRSVVLAYEPATTLPDTLKAQRTDTDKLWALGALVKVVKTHAGEPWADKLTAGRFGTQVPKVEAALHASVEAGTALAVVRQERADAHQAVYGPFLAFKRVVRDALGASSVYYRRLNPRAAVSKDIDPAEDEAAPDSGVMPSGNAAPAQGNEPSQVKVV